MAGFGGGGNPLTVPIPKPGPLNADPLHGGAAGDKFRGYFTPPVNKYAGMPLDADGRIALQQAAAARAAFMGSVNKQQQADNLGYGQQLDSFEVQHPVDERALRSNYAADGGLFSSGYGNADEQLGTKYNTALANLLTNNNQALSALRQSKSGYQKQYLTDIDAIREAAAERIAANNKLQGTATA